VFSSRAPVIRDELFSPRVDPKVYFEAPDLKPYSTSLCQVSTLRRFRNTQQVGIKMSGLLFTSGRHGELNVMDSSDFAFAHEGIENWRLAAMKPGIKAVSSRTAN
jgi:hypothetical protein